MTAIAQPATSAQDVRQQRPGFGGPAYRYLRVSDHLPSTDAAIAAADPMVLVHLFNPTGQGDWYVTGFDPETGIATGAARIHELDVGDFWMPELVDTRLRFGLYIERDLHWKVVPLSTILEKERSR